MANTKESFMLNFQAPPQPYLHTYNRLLPSSSQSPDIPPVFLSALAVREKVFVEEQKACPLEHHIDYDDGRSCHWVAFSASNQATSPIPTLSHHEIKFNLLSKAIGTLRLIPFPQSSPHPEPNSHLYAPPLIYSPPAPAEEIFFGPTPEFRRDRVTTFHDGVEPYIKLGRWAVLPEWRGKGVGDALVEAALSWATRRENRAWAEGKGEGYGRWKGLVFVGAQEMAVRTWERNGFVVDEKMGVWWEAGIKHWGLWRRVDVGEGEQLVARDGD